MLRSAIIVALLINPTLLAAQEVAERPKDNRVTAAQELETVITEAKPLSDKNVFVNISARAAGLISVSDAARAEQMLIDLWKFSNSQTGEDFDRHEARVRVLKHLHSRNPKLARRLMAELLNQESPSTPARALGLDAESELPGKLAAALLDTDPAGAGALLEQHLTTVVTMEGAAALSRLREKNFLLADYIAAKVIDAMTTRPTLTSLPGLHTLGAYAFAGSEAPLPSIEAESSRQSLQFRYFGAGVEVLRASLSESSETLVKDRQYSQLHLQFRSAYQAELAAILAALATRFQPALAAELSGIATKLAPQVPTRMPRLPQTTLARLSGNFSSEDPEQRFFFALSTGDFDTARTELERVKESDKRDLYAQLVIKSEARAFLARSEFMDAVTAIRKIEDPTARLVMYLDALKTTQKKRDAEVAHIITNEARLLVPQTNRNGLHLRALFAFAFQLYKTGSREDAAEFLSGAVSTINALSGHSDGRGGAKSFAKGVVAELNDPTTLLDEPEMEQAFTAIGLLDLDSGLTYAKRIQPKAVQLLARLQTIQGVIKQATSKPKGQTAPRAAPTVKSLAP